IRVMSLHAGDRLLRALVFAMALQRQKPRHAAPPAAGDYSFIADEKDAVTAFAHALLAVVGIDSRRRAGAQAAVIPLHGHRRHVLALAKTIGIDRARR